MDPHRIGELRSLAYHQAVVERLDGAMLDRARARACRWSEGGGRATPHLHRWRQLLDGRREDLIAVLTADTEEARTLRSTSPFAGELAPRERWAIWAEVREKVQ